MQYTEEQAFDYLYSIREYLKLKELDYLVSDLISANNLRLCLNNLNSKENTVYSLLADTDIQNKLIKIGLDKNGGKYILSYRCVLFILEYYGILDNLPEQQETQSYPEQNVLVDLRTRYNNLLDNADKLNQEKNDLERLINDLHNQADKLCSAIKVLETVL